MAVYGRHILLCENSTEIAAIFLQRYQPSKDMLMYEVLLLLAINVSCLESTRQISFPGSTGLAQSDAS